MYICVNCGKPVKTLFKKYSATVLKLTDCESCNKTADKYVEYDVIIIIIDLVLLHRTAYRHVLFNTKFHNFWKLSVILLLMEAYSELMRLTPEIVTEEEEKPFLNEFNEMTDLLFYKLSLIVAIKSVAFISIIYLMTCIYCLATKKEHLTFLKIWQTLTVSSFGTFLLLPSLIWDSSLQEIHLSVVSLYTTMSQLLAYTVLCDCPKFWSIITIFFAYYAKFACPVAFS